MSAFMVSNETINCVCTIDKLVGGSCERRDLFGRDLLAMNSAAVNTRYPAQAQQAAADFAFRFSPRRYSKVQQFKALQCLIYQCSEGEAIESRELYKQLESVKTWLAGEIVADLPEYNAAEWDLTDRPRAGKVTA